jgi:hypothetical protein
LRFEALGRGEEDRTVRRDCSGHLRKSGWRDVCRGAESRIRLRGRGRGRRHVLGRFLVLERRVCVSPRPKKNSSSRVNYDCSSACRRSRTRRATQDGMPRHERICRCILLSGYHFDNIYP